MLLLIENGRKPAFMAELCAKIIRKFAGTPLAKITVAILAILSLSFQFPTAAQVENAGSDLDYSLFSQRSLQRIKITLCDSETRILRNHPRKYVRGRVEIGGFRYEDAAIHLKGSAGSFQRLDEKPSLTLDFTRFGSLEGFRGLEKIHLNNSVEDPSFLNELIGAECFRAAGIPVPRVAHAVVELNGRKLGLYVLKEGFTRRFFERSFDQADGALYQPESFDESGERMKTVAEHLNRDEFLGFIATELLICHRDGYSLAKNNFRVYYENSIGRAEFLPTGMDQLFGKADYPLNLQMAGELSQALVSTPAGKLALNARLKELYPLSNPAVLNERIGRVIAMLKRDLPRRDFKNVASAAADFKERIAQRHEFLKEKLEPAHSELRMFAATEGRK